MGNLDIVLNWGGGGEGVFAWDVQEIATDYVIHCRMQTI